MSKQVFNSDIANFLLSQSLKLEIIERNIVTKYLGDPDYTGKLIKIFDIIQKKCEEADSEIEKIIKDTSR